MNVLNSRVAELEQENARLRQLASAPHSAADPSSQALACNSSVIGSDDAFDEDADVSGGGADGGDDGTEEDDVDALKSKLAEARRREAELTRRLGEAANLSKPKISLDTTMDVGVKREVTDTNGLSLEDVMSTSSGASSPVIGNNRSLSSTLVPNPKTGASLGLMVCASICLCMVFRN